MAATDSEYQNQRFLTLRRFRDLPDALLFESILDSAEIECFLADENLIRMDWLWSNFLGGVKLCVRKADVDAASSLLAQRVPEAFNVEGAEQYQQPRCPECRSVEVSFTGLNKPLDYARAILSGPRPLQRSLWECDSCGLQWPESTEKPPTDLLMSISSILLILITIEAVGGTMLDVIVTLRLAMTR